MIKLEEGQQRKLMRDSNMEGQTQNPKLERQKLKKL
jgi:hypothetical protein